MQIEMRGDFSVGTGVFDGPFLDIYSDLFDWFIKTIIFPFCRVLVNILPDPMIIVIITNDMVI